MEYVLPKELFVFDHEGDLYEVETQGVSLRTTLNHRMWVKQRNSDKYELVTAENVKGKRVRYQCNAETNNSTLMKLDLGNYQLENDKINTWLRIFGIWIAEGWTYIKEKEYINRIEFAANKDRVYKELVESCNILGFNYSFNEKTKKFYINHKEIALYLDPLSNGAINKSLQNGFGY